MKVLHLVISLEGGAGGSAYKLHQGLREAGASSLMLVQNKSISDESVMVIPKAGLARKLNRLRPKFDRLPLKLYPNRRGFFSVQWVPDFIASKVEEIRPDVINLRWVLGGYLRIETIAKFKKPIVWTLSDMWPFTGGCDYSEGCDRYTDNCGACPQLRSDKSKDLSRWVWQRKAKAWQDLDLTIVSPSSWLVQCAESSSLFKHLRIEKISTGVDTKKFKPIDRKVAREHFQLPQDKQLILFGAWISDRRKGFHLLQPALQSLSKSGLQDKIEVVVFGFSEPNRPLNLGFKTHYLGRLNDQTSLAIAYSAADVFVAPSIQDNLPNTVIEAIACGTPCVAFKIGGMPDMIEHQQNGYLAQPYDIEDLAKGIAWILADDDRYLHLAHRARQKAEQGFTLELQARRYLDLYNEIVEKRNRSVYAR